MFADAEPWADARVRALAACLMDCLLAQPGALPGLAACIRDSDATAWAEQLAAVSYGDPFFGACVSLTLLPCMLPEVQVSTAHYKMVSSTSACALSSLPGSISKRHGAA